VRRRINVMRDVLFSRSGMARCAAMSLGTRRCGQAVRPALPRLGKRIAKR
jgi:hypothetical protein